MLGNHRVLLRMKPILRHVANVRWNHSAPDGTLAENYIRNIGILAHIDGGKTTTTERMLYYSGKTNVLGEVHHGNTVTDFLEQERERGITICSAAVSFEWKDHRINLLDTPGHIDFTMEVEQSLGAVDGTVVILDGSAGVEAQTVTVWGQADRHKLPRVVFVNKMDKDSADFEGCLQDMKKKLGIVPLPLQLPLMDGGKLAGIIDILSRTQIVWDKNTNGRTYRRKGLNESSLIEAQGKLHDIIDVLSGKDDLLAQAIIESDSMENVKPELLLAAIRTCTMKQLVVPVLLGSAYKNIGVQLLMDAVLKYLPAPNERNEIYDCFGSDFVGKVFKVTHDKQRGPLSLIRVFRGSVKKGAKITTAKGVTETIQRIYAPWADEYREIATVGAGNIGLCAGPKSTVTGDLVVTNASSLKNAIKKLDALSSRDEENDLGVIVASKLSLCTVVPDAVYFCSIEPPSSAYQTALDNALRELQREDPSLRVSYDETTMQTVLGGMGRLHLEIIKSRILTEYKIDVDLGPLQIAYKETLEQPIRGCWAAEKEIVGSKQLVQMEVTIHEKRNHEKFHLDNSPEAQDNLKLVRPKQMSFVRKGTLAALERGPRLGGQLTNVAATLHHLVIGKGTSDTFIMAATAQCVRHVLSTANCRLLEPVMLLEIAMPSEYLNAILADLSRRRATVEDVQYRGPSHKVLLANAPLAELDDYSSEVRCISSGTASVSMQPNGYVMLNEMDEATAIRRAHGLE
ncbi:ribosome-releasing factor 2, mitochondrial [Toxorhynchites rutilus septentrionalis]|uniref:ribosome-releasing factor 2, mitochondrial n=1 Tax=Toxorhynchites rutilus septentrionalis TaxID=329112 RepID=UPI0024785377|nr:ribosome-releasing factor 2, mitochondrial [Toxorhynchites rutilus septentrionalis]